MSEAHNKLTKLISLRSEPTIDVKELDKHIWDQFGETWCVMFTDLSGFSRNVVRFGVIHFLQVIQESERLFFPIIAKHDGIFLKKEGDSFLVLFKNTDNAIKCAIEMQQATVVYNSEHLDEDDILLCVGLGFGKMIKVDYDVFGAEVNFASKLGEDLAQAGEILVTEAAVLNSSLQHKFVELEKKIVGLGTAFKLNY